MPATLLGKMLTRIWTQTKNQPISRLTEVQVLHVLTVYVYLNTYMHSLANLLGTLYQQIIDLRDSDIIPGILPILWVTPLAMPSWIFAEHNQAIGRCLERQEIIAWYSCYAVDQPQSS